MPVIDKMKKAAWQMCGAEDVELSAKAKEKLERYIKQVEFIQNSIRFIHS